MANFGSNSCVLITSVISPDNAPLNYSETRSVYGDEERFYQTLETLTSVRKHMPLADICLLECSPPSNRIKFLENSVELFKNLYPNDNIRKNPRKGVGEACMLQEALNLTGDKCYETFFKLTGRYLLNAEFDLMQYLNDKIVLRQTEHYGGPSMHTFFYKFPRCEVQFFKNLFKLIELDLKEEAVESYMLSHMNMQNVLSVPATLGVTARWSCYGSTNNF
jgi:hypothetical protein